MTHTERIPAWLRIAAAMMVGEHLAVFITRPITALSAVSLGVTVLLAWFLLQGSRVAWVLAFLSAIAGLTAPFTLDQPVWLVVTGVIILGCLLASSSREFVWAESRRRPSGSWRSAAKRADNRILAVAYAWLARMATPGGWSSRKEGHGKLIAVLAVCVVLLVPVVGAVYQLHHGSGRGSVFVDVLWRVVWIGSSLARVALIALLAMAAYNYVTKRRQRLES